MGVGDDLKGGHQAGKVGFFWHEIEGPGVVAAGAGWGGLERLSQGADGGIKVLGGYLSIYGDDTGPQLCSGCIPTWFYYLCFFGSHLRRFSHL